MTARIQTLTGPSGAGRSSPGRSAIAAAVLIGTLITGFAVGRTTAATGNTATAAGQPVARDLTPRLPGSPIQDQNDRLLASLRAEDAKRTQAAVELARSMERNR
jgi:hypothetical protein